MSFLKFITVDMLCIAAEVTAALLLLAFAIPEKKKTVQPDKTSEELDQLATRARQYCIESAMFRGLTILRDPVHTSFHDSAEMAESLKAIGYEDKLTSTANHAFADAFLAKWLRLPVEHRMGSSLAMVVVDEYSDLLRAKGAMALEVILRRFSEMIKAEFGATSIISRYQPDRFLILSFCGDISEAYTTLVSLRKRVNESAQDESSGHSAFDCTSSIVHLGDEDINLEQAIEDLDDGISQASENAEKCIAKASNQEWTDSATVLSASSGSVVQSKSNSGTGHADSASTEWKDTGKTDGGSSSTIDDQNEVSTLPKAANDTTVPNDSDAPESPASKEAKPPSDVQAVAKNEDIEALFEQINKNKKSNAAAVETQQADPTPPPQDAPSATELDVSESATADDIAALFATVKGAAQPAAPKPSETPTPKAAQSTAEDENGTASADDIAALFASVQNTPKAQQAVVPPPVESTPVQDVSTTPAPAPENLDEAASADDIAALFASAKNNKQGTPPKAQPVAPPAPTAAAPVASENLEETASADDIAALFAASKKPAPPNKAPAEINNAKAPPAEITAEGKKNIEALVQNLNESASADEIEALFANLK
jgi:GGDEF domain-containing protein